MHSEFFAAAMRERRQTRPGNLLVLLLLTLLTVGAAGQQPPEIQAVPTRPNFTNATDTVQPGVLQMEYGTTWQRMGTESYAESFSGTYTLGVSSNVDLRWSADHILVSQTRDRNDFGTGDNWLGVRYRLFEQRKRVPSVGVLYQVKVPTSDPKKNLGTGHVDHSLALLLSKDIRGTRIDCNLVGYAMGGNGWDTSTLGSLAISHTLSGRLGGLFEGYGGRARDGSGVGSLFTAMTWKWNQRLVSDAGVEFGLTTTMPQSRFVFGVSYALARMWRPAK